MRGSENLLDLTRRRALAALTGGIGAIAGAKAVDNVFLGYGVVVGTNLLEQDLGPIVAEELDPSPFEVGIGGARIEYFGSSLRITDGDRDRTLPIDDLTEARGADIDAEFELPGDPVARLAADLLAIERGDVRYEFDGYRAFFDRLDAVDTRALAVESLRSRRWTGVDPATVQGFSGASAEDPGAVVEALAEGFREHTHYDAARYVAGSIDDNVLSGAGDLRGHFESSTTFEAMEGGEDSGLFCWDFTYRSIEALQAAAAHRQAVPTFGWEVYDARHGHVFTAVGSVYRRQSELTVSMTFLDYSRATWYDDYRLRWLLGEGIDAYDRRHRVTRFIS